MTSDPARARHTALIDAALALADVRGERGVETILGVVVEAAGRITGTAAALALAGADGRLEGLTVQGVDGSTREAFTRPDVLAALFARLRALGRPLAARDLDPETARALSPVAPHGLLVVPLEADAFLALVQLAAETELDADSVGSLAVLARLAAAALGNLRSWATCAELRHMSNQILVRQDEALARTAHELHEGICQRLAAANAQLEALAAMLDGQRGALARLRDARSLVNQTLGELRELAQRMRPSVLANLGYVEALRWYLKRLRERSGMTLSLEIEGAETRLPLAMETALYRATEEALEPAAGAREPRRLRVRYRREPEAVRIEIAGTPPDAVDLVAIRERLRPFGGAVRVTSTPDERPVIAVEVPARTN